MDSEPVAYMHDGEDGTEYNGHDEFSGGGKGIPLYRHAQPAPVAPVCTCPSGDGSLRWPCPVHPGNSRVIPDGYVMVPAEPNGDMLAAAQDAYGETDGDIASTLRAAMLAAAPQSPGSEPATVPGKWIPVSERMPETDGNYWGWWSESKRQGPVWFIKSELQAQFQSSEITHWMPLPAAPQEVKGE
ncbi:DUF551 domain-containing protein [Klebsiella quasipneumoniae]|nr:DUF551 domain-containing protein [Klebsiella quasipneumoniae]